MSKRLTTDELFYLLRYEVDKFFSVEFERRLNRPGKPAGSIRKMLCRTNMTKFKQGIISDLARDTRDFQHGILTVFDITTYLRFLRQGIAPEIAGPNSYRCIDLVSTKTIISELEIGDLPPDVVANMHQITNAYRLANMPRGTVQ